MSSGSNITEGVFESGDAFPTDKPWFMVLPPIEEDADVLSHSLRGGIEMESDSSELLREVEEDLVSEFDS